jgi:hypothetical protein
VEAIGNHWTFLAEAGVACSDFHFLKKDHFRNDTEDSLKRSHQVESSLQHLKYDFSKVLFS